GPVFSAALAAVRPPIPAAAPESRPRSHLKNALSHASTNPLHATATGPSQRHKLRPVNGSAQAYCCTLYVLFCNRNSRDFPEAKPFPGRVPAVHMPRKHFCSSEKRWSVDLAAYMGCVPQLVIMRAPFLPQSVALTHAGPVAM